MIVPILIGLPGSGKSYLAKKASKRFKIKMLDMDDVFFKRHSLSPGKFIIDHGEEEFRSREREILIEILDSKEEKIVASGGGTPCYSDNMEIILQKANPIFLDIGKEILIKRLEKEKELRPWLAVGADLFSVLEQLYHKRRPYYEKARVTIFSSEIEDQLEILKPYCSGKN